MQTRATAKIRIPATTEVVATIAAHTRAIQYCVDVAWQNKIRNNVKLHPLVYDSLRKTFLLPAQIAVSCIKQACGIVKKAKTKPVINRSSVRYNFPRSAGLSGNKLTFRTLNNREKVELNIPKAYTQYFTGWKANESLLRIDRKNRAFFLFVFSKEVDAASSCLQTRVLGIDLGINNLAVTSDCKFFNSCKVKQAKRRFKFIRSKLQAKGTRASKRLLRKIAGRETRYMVWINHNVSKNIVSSFDGNKIVMEDLKGIRKQNRSRKMNYWISNWSFFQLQNFMQYKAERKGVVVERVKPAYTSQICHRCGQIGSRLHGSFACHCGLTSYSADLNAAKNLSHPMLVARQAAVNQPYLTCNEDKARLCCELSPSIVKSSAS